MGTTQDKLSYLGVTKDLIYGAIIEKGGALKEDATFRQYVDGIKSIPTVEGGGGDVKLFETKEEMQEDTESKENDLAIIYGTQIQNATANSELQIIKFDQTVILPSAFTGNAYCSFRNNDTWADGMIEMSSTDFRFRFYSENSNFEVTYTSTDGITYTRTDTNPETVDTGIPLTCDYKDDWDDAMGYFIQALGYNFNGLYKNVPYKDTNRIKYPLMADNIDNLQSIDNLNFSNIILAEDLAKAGRALRELLDVERVICTSVLNTANNKVYILIDAVDSDKFDGMYLHIRNRSDTDLTPMHVHYTSTNAIDNLNVYEVSDDFNSVTLVETVVPILHHTSSSNTYTFKYDFRTTFNTMRGADIDVIKYSDGSIKSVVTRGQTVASKYSYSGDNAIWTNNINIPFYDIYNKYLPAPTQLDATPEFVWEKTYYGRDGVETGTLHKLDNLTSDQILAHMDIYTQMTGIVLTNETYKFASNNMKIPKLVCYGLDTSRVTNMNNMFAGAMGLTEIDLTGLDTSNVTDMHDMFYRAWNLTSIDASSFNTSKVTKMYNMFRDCEKVTSINVSSFDTTNVTDMSSMFQNCEALTSLDLSSFHTPNLVDTSDMFWDCGKLMYIDMSNFDFSKITNGSRMFDYVPGRCLIYVKDEAAKNWIVTNHRYEQRSSKRIIKYNRKEI